MQIIIMIPGAVRVIHVILIEQILVVIKGERAMIFWKPELPAIASEKSTILHRIPICDRRLVKICFDIRAQVKCITFLGPGRKMRATTLKDIRRCPSLHIDWHLIDHISRIRNVINIDIRMRCMELFEMLPGHGLEPIVIEILIDQLSILPALPVILGGVNCMPRMPSL